MGKVEITKTPLSTYVNGKETYPGPWGHLLLKENGSLAANYVIQEIRNKPLTAKEKIYYKDGNVKNIDPSNLLVVERGLGESSRAFGARVKRLLGKIPKRKMKMAERIPDLHTRKTTSNKSLLEQINIVQASIDRMWIKEGNKCTYEDRLECASVSIGIAYPDVQLEDLILDEPPLQKGESNV